MSGSILGAAGIPEHLDELGYNLQITFTRTCDLDRLKAPIDRLENNP